MSGAPTDLRRPAPPPGGRPVPSPDDAPVRPPWYRRRGVLLVGGVTAVLAITVITDLPSPTSRATDIASATAVINDVNADISPCVFAVDEALTIYGDQTRGSLTVADRARIPGLLGDDQTACSFANESIFNLSEIDVPGSASGKHLGSIVSSVTLWTTSDALGAIEAVQRLITDPHNAQAQAALAKDKTLMASDRAEADASLTAVDTMLGTKLVGLALGQGQAPATAGAPSATSSTP
jgi:hypothetical protein